MLGATASAFLYDPATDQWTPTAGNLQVPRFLAEATTLPDGRPMIIGGLDGVVVAIRGMGVPTLFPHYTNAVDVFDPVTSTFQVFPQATAPGVVGVGHRASTTPSGNVIVTGGHWIRKWDRTSWTYWGGIAPGGYAYFHGQALLPNGDVHVSGVKGITQFPNYAFNLCFRSPGFGVTQTASVPLPPGAIAIQYQVEIALMDGTILIAGGEDSPSGNTGPASSAAWLYTPAP